MLNNTQWTSLTCVGPVTFPLHANLKDLQHPTSRSSLSGIGTASGGWKRWLVWQREVLRDRQHAPLCKGVKLSVTKMEEGKAGEQGLCASGS